MKKYSIRDLSQLFKYSKSIEVKGSKYIFLNFTVKPNKEMNMLPT